MAGCVLAIAFLLAQLLCFGYGRDQGIYAVVARAMLDGGMPYRDAWDFKPPGIFLIYALARALFGEAQARHPHRSRRSAWSRWRGDGAARRSLVG